MKTVTPPKDRFEKLLHQAILDLEMHREPEAVEHLRRALGLKPDSAEAWFWLGRACEEQDDLKGACYCFNLSLCCNDRHNNSRQALQRLGWFPDEGARPGQRV
jgi:hypothetical protein